MARIGSLFCKPWKFWMKSLRSFTRLVVVAAGVLAAASSFAATKTIQHHEGEITLDGVPKRVVVLGHGSLDTLDRLGVEPVGVVKAMMPTYLDKYQDKKYAAMGSVKEPDFEAIYMAKPDLIIAEARLREMMGELNKIAPTIMYAVDYGEYWKDTQANWRMLGEVFDKQTEADALIANTQAKLDDTRAKAQASQMKAMMVMNNGSNLAMFNQGSRFSMVFDEFGFNPARSEEVKTTGSHGNLISFEYIADAKPDVIFVLDREQAIGKEIGKAKSRFNNVLVKSTPASQNDRIVYLNPNAWYITMAGVTATDIMIDDIAQLF